MTPKTTDNIIEILALGVCHLIKDNQYRPVWYGGTCNSFKITHYIAINQYIINYI